MTAYKFYWNFFYSCGVNRIFIRQFKGYQFWIWVSQYFQQDWLFTRYIFVWPSRWIPPSPKSGDAELPSPIWSKCTGKHFLLFFAVFSVKSYYSLYISFCLYDQITVRIIYVIKDHNYQVSNIKSWKLSDIPLRFMLLGSKVYLSLDHEIW